MKRIILLIIYIVSLSSLLIAQDATEDEAGESLVAVLTAIRDAQTDYTVHFIANDLEHLRVKTRVRNLSAKDAVERACKGQPVKVKRKGRQVFVQYRKETDLTGKIVHLVGSVEDGFLQMPLIDAKVSVLRTDSSIVVDSAQMLRIYNGQGRLLRAQFGAEVSAAEREYLVRGQLDGYDDAWQQVTIPRPLKEEVVEVPTLKMRRMRHVNLDEVVITATKVKFFWRGDTLIYDATAFQMPEGSMLDDLIRQLPGVTMNADGEIFVNGRKVDELLLGSRTFFGGNKHVLMENLPYYTVKDLKVYEKQTDKSEALGYDVEPRRYVMDVNLKDEFSQGYIANMEAAGGTEQRWLGRSFLLGFTDHLRLTLLANANNVNETRHIGQSGQWSPARQPRSLTTTRSVATELSYFTKGDKLKETLRADFTSSTDEQTMRQHREQFLESFTPTSLTETFNRAANAKLNVHNSLTLKEPSYFNAEADFGYSRHDGSFYSAFDEWSDSLTVSQRTVGMSKGRAWNANVAIQGVIKVGCEGSRHVDYFFNVKHTDDESEKASDFETVRSSVSPSRRDTHNANTLFNRSTFYISNLGYSMKLGEELNLGISDVFYIRSQQSRDWLYHPDSLLLPSQIDALAAITDPSNSYDSHNRDWSNDVKFRLYKSSYYVHPLAHMKISYDRFSLELGTPLSHECLHYQRGRLDTLAHQTVFLPKATFRFRNVWKGGQRDLHLYVDFNQDRTLLLDRIDFRDDSQPLIVKLGNPDLKSSMQTNFNVEYYDRTGPRNGTYHLSSSFSYHHRDIAQSFTYNPKNGVYTYKPMNVSGAYGAFAMFSTDQNIGEKRYWTWHFDVGPLWDHAKDHVMLDGETESHVNTVNTFALNSGANIRFNRKTLNVRAVGSVNWRHSMGQMYDFATLNVLFFECGMEAYYITSPLWKKAGGGLTLSADATMYGRRGYGSAGLDHNDFVVNASLSQPFFNGKLIARLEAFDLLHQLSPVDYTINAQGRVVTWYRSLPHYVMLHLVWHFNHNPKTR